jgi:sugar O-acyltransferase (sialic acid O-acetyltransferase NeuD family)
VLENRQKSQIVIIGSGGHASSIIDILKFSEDREIWGVVSLELKESSNLDGITVVGDDSCLGELIQRQFSFVIAVGQISSSEIRYKLFKKLEESKADIPVIISPDAYVSPRAFIGRGTVVFHRVVINSNARIGENCILNNMCLIEHDAVIGSHTHVSTGAIINGNAHVGSHCFIGSGSIISNNVSICDSVILGAGSNVVKDIKEQGVYFGNPAKKSK